MIAQHYRDVPATEPLPRVIKRTGGGETEDTLRTLCIIPGGRE